MSDLTSETIDWGHKRPCPSCGHSVQWHDGEESWASCTCNLPVSHFAVYDNLAALQQRVAALTLPAHKCEMVAAAQWNDVGGRAHWVGRLLEPIPGYEEETHCMHFVTPLKGEVVFGFILADFHQLAALCEAIAGPIHPAWLDLKSRDYIGNVRYLRQQGVPEAMPHFSEEAKR